MKRRDFVKTAGLAAAASAAAMAPKAMANDKKTRTLTMVTSWPKHFPGVGTAADDFIRILEAVSDGRYKVKLYGSGELVPGLKVFDAVQEGTADLYHSADYYFKGKNTAFAYFTGVPFGFTAPEMDAWLLYGGGQKLWDELSAEFGVKAFPCGNSGCQMGGWFKKEINSTEDFKGLKMRIPGLGGDVLSELGGTPVALAGSEIMPALESGAIDATEFVGPWNDLAFGFYKVVKNYYYPGFHEPGTTLSLGIGKKFWDSLSKADQAMFQYCALAANNNNYAEFNAKNAGALDTLITKHGVTLREFSDATFRAMGEATKEVLAKAGQDGAMARKVSASYDAFRKTVLSWTHTGQLSYMQKRRLVTF